MDLSSPLRSLAPGLDSAVLEVLCRTEAGLNAVQIARLSSRGTRVGQRPVLERLVEHGLVIADRANTGFTYRLNRDHVLAPAVLAAAAARREVLDRLTAACERFHPRPMHASVFGSFARGEGGPASDIDLLLVTGDGVDQHGDDWESQVFRLDSDVTAWTGNRLQALTFTEARLTRLIAAEEPLIATWSADAVTLIGPQPTALLARLAGPTT
ncbi:MAG: nucleotidyltransferase domain-containing protein [Actinomycetales bacterium]